MILHGRSPMEFRDPKTPSVGINFLSRAKEE